MFDLPFRVLINYYFLYINIMYIENRAVSMLMPVTCSGQRHGEPNMT